eukprot:m.126848 g.126848  ORF g.126848 m.126848 type:complete len:334 (-) comp13844_c0_seq8:1235-2236(-)
MAEDKGPQAAPAQPAVSALDAGHKDWMNDVAFNYYGTQFATCGGDHEIHIWRQQNSSWQQTSTLRQHQQAVLRVVWAHPEYGNVIASCSLDKYVMIWEERVDPVEGAKWEQKAKLAESSTPVTDVAFVPHSLRLDALLLAAASEDGVVRFYLAHDVMNLTSWIAKTEIRIKAPAQGSHRPCISWSTARSLPPLIAIGTRRNPKESVQIWKFDPAGRNHELYHSMSDLEDVYDVAFAPSMGRSSLLLAVACARGSIRLFEISALPGEPTKTDVREVSMQRDTLSGPTENLQVTRVSWNVTGTILATSIAGLELPTGQHILWQPTTSGTWIPQTD